MSDDSDDYLYWMKTQGYYVVPGAIQDQSFLARLRGGIDRAVDQDEEAARSGRYRNFFAPGVARLMIDRGEEFVELAQKSPVQNYVDLLLGDTCIIRNYSAVRLAPNLKNMASNVHKDSPRFSPGYLLSVQVLFFVDDFTAETGATWLLPGSHNAEERPSDEQFFSRGIQVFGKAGTALIFDSQLWHAGGDNVSAAPRRGIAIVYTRSFIKQEIDFVRALKPETLARLDDTGRRLIGWNVRVPESLEEFYLPEAERLYKGGQG
jgi:ectoine hydroxylase-related dioxygenase (phytanoyl-CoA dioxygenase family)